MKNPGANRFLLSTFCTGVLLAALSPRAAEAAFYQAVCPTSPSYVSVPVALGALNFDKAPALAPMSSNDGVGYGHNTRSTWRIYANGNVDTAVPWAGDFNSEPSWDFLRITGRNPATPQNTVDFTYSGNINSWSSPPLRLSSTWSFRYPGFPLSGGGWVQLTGPSWFDVYWKTDNSFNRNSVPQFAKLDVSCAASQTATLGTEASLGLNRRVDGLFLANGDTLGFQVSLPANTSLLVSLDMLYYDTASGVRPDWDLYASDSVANPDYTNATWSETSTSSNSALNIPSSSVARTIHIAAHSYSGKGHFSLHALGQSAATTGQPDHRVLLTVRPFGFGSPLTDDQKQSQPQFGLTPFMKRGSLRFLTATNGNVWFDRFVVKAWNDPVECQNATEVPRMCISRVEPYYSASRFIQVPSSTSFCNTVSYVGNAWWEAYEDADIRFAHFASHFCLGLDDNWKHPITNPDPNRPPLYLPADKLCGHSLNSDFADGNEFLTGLCSRAHCLDGNSSDTTQCNPSDPSDWQKIRAAGYASLGPDWVAIDETPDPTPYWKNDVLLNMISVTYE